MASLHHTFSEAHREEVFRQLADSLGGAFINNEGWRKDKVVARSGPWVITLDVAGEPGWKMETHLTRLRAPFLNADRFRFHIYRKHLSDSVAKLMGMQDVPCGDKAVDDAYILQSNNPAQLKRLLSNSLLRTRLMELPEADLAIRDNDGELGPEFPPGVDELRFQAPGVVDDVEKLRQIYSLFAEVLRTLCHIGSAYEQDPHLTL